MCILKSTLRPIVPYSVKQKLRLLQLSWFGRPQCDGETSKARGRRIESGFFERYCSGEGLDIGYGGDLLKAGCVGWDWEHGDAQYLATVDDESFDFAYSSHTLEHLHDPAEALRNWFRVIRHGGYLILLYSP